MAQGFELSLAELKELKKRKKETTSPKIYRRLLFLEMKQQGRQHQEIAPLVDACMDTLTDWLRLFEEGGFEKLCSLDYEGRRLSKLEPYKHEIKEFVEKGKVKTLDHLRFIIQKKHAVSMKKSGLSKFLKKNSIVRIKKHD